MKKLLALIATIFVTVTFSGCSGITQTSDVYSQQVNWQLCEDGVFQCTKIQVPLDWDKPEGDTIQLSVIRKFTNNAIGSLLSTPVVPVVRAMTF